MGIVDAKLALRLAAKERRRITATKGGTKAAARLADHLATQFKGFVGKVISGYLPIGSEIDVVPALQILRQRGLIIALPVIICTDRPLAFRHWKAEMKLEPGPLHTRHPPANSPEIIPDLIIVPLLAFDSEGYRIGWGGGYYDRTLMKLREVKPIIAVGAAFSAQKVKKIPRDQNDARLDWIATEMGMIEIESAR